MRPHRRDWRRLWRYCWCGLRWTCPDVAPVVPMPFNPDPGGARNQRTVHDRPAANGPAGSRGWNQRSAWNGPTWFGHRVGRAGALTPAQHSRTGDNRG
ncbi:hypothetical protein [Plantactinospora sp. B5E13]|uniref:hypothetical protein n=1 Tax=unclassified Plantactinospora TaxID=2631981 RepID=UPI00325D6C05